MRFKLIETNKTLLLDLNFKTALLESVGWDETQSASLLQYLQSTINKNTESPESILDKVFNEYGEDAANFVKKLFLDAYITNGLYRKKEDDYEH